MNQLSKSVAVRIMLVNSAVYIKQDGTLHISHHMGIEVNRQVVVGELTEMDARALVQDHGCHFSVEVIANGISTSHTGSRALQALGWLTETEEYLDGNDGTFHSQEVPA